MSFLIRKLDFQFEEIQKHMAGCHADLRVPGGKFPEARHVGSEDEADGHLGNIISAEVCRGIRTVEVPASLRFYGNPAHADGVIWQRDEVHLRLEPLDADGVKFEPFFAGVFVKNKIGLVCNMPRDISRANVPFSMNKRIIFLFVYMDFGMRKIRQPADMIKMHVGQENVLYIVRLVSESGELIDGRLLRVKWHVGDDAKELREPGGVGVILQAQTRIHEDKTMIRIDQQADQSRFPPAWDTSATSEAIEDANSHDRNIA